MHHLNLVWIIYKRWSILCSQLVIPKLTRSKFSRLYSFKATWITSTHFISVSWIKITYKVCMMYLSNCIWFIKNYPLNVFWRPPVIYCICALYCTCKVCLRIFFFIIHLFCIVWREGQGRYELLTMVGAGGTRTCVHPHVSRPLYHCATDADSDKGLLYSLMCMNNHNASQGLLYTVHVIELVW